MGATTEIGTGTNGLMYTSGTYVCLYDGNGDISFEQDATLVSVIC
jgi:hypothetical protein